MYQSSEEVPTHDHGGENDQVLGAAPTVPSGLSQRWRYYSRRYGRVHAALRFVGTRLPDIWPMIGPVATASYLRCWRKRGGTKILNLGGGGNCLRGCLTVDIDPRADVYVDLRQALPFDDGEIDHVYFEEAIEHLDKPVALRLLRECWRVLRPSGTLRVTTPDLDWMAYALVRNAIGCDVFNECFYGHSHRYLYNHAELAALMHDAGFSNVKLSTFRDRYPPLGHWIHTPLAFTTRPNCLNTWT